MSALLGTQPKFRQSPPIKFRSTRATRPPNAAVPAAATNPAVPAPMTMTLQISLVLVFIKLKIGELKARCYSSAVLGVDGRCARTHS